MVALVAGREITSRLRDKTFIVSSVFLLVLVAASVTIPIILQGRSDRPSVSVVTVGSAAASTAQKAASISDAAYATAQAAEDQPGPTPDSGIPQTRLKLSSAPDVDAAQAAVQAGTAEVALVPAGGAVQLVADRSVPDDVSELVSRAVAEQRVQSALAGTNADPARVERALSDQAPAQRLLNENAAQQGLAIVLGFVFTSLFFLTVFSFGMSIAQSVVEEKQSRIVELLVSAVPVRVLLMGKVLGNTALALGQIVLLIAVGLAGASIAGQSEIVTLLLRTSGWFTAFFVLGFVMLACLWAAAGALASRQEDLQSTTLPLQVLVMVPFFASIYIVEPGRWLTILSYVPFTAPLVMPRRLALGDASALEALVSAGIVVLTAAVIVTIGARLYAGGLLRTQAKAGWRDAWAR
jgi:ABC-2 type transport system permease protein